MVVRRVWARAAAAAWRRRVAALALAAAALCVGAGGVRAAVDVASRADFPTTAPADMAHLLADFSTHPHASVSPRGSWYVVEERGNYSTWSYRVTFECGTRCAGAAAVSHWAGEREAGGTAPRHGPAPAHRVRLDVVTCTRLPLLPWPTFCEEMEVESAVTSAVGGGGGGGCTLEERARARCSLPRVLTGACARDLRAHRKLHLESLRARLRQHHVV